MEVHEDEITYPILPHPEDQYDFDSLPAEHCFYCGIHNVMSIALCECGKWFCNSKGLSSSSSHIVVHLKKSSHKSISNHQMNINYIGTYKCLNCHTTDVFVLEIHQTLEIFCRRCSLKTRIEEPELKINEFIEGSQVNPKMIHIPSQTEKDKARQITKSQINIIEKNISLGKDPFEGLDDAPQFAPPLPKIKLRYNDKAEYYEIYTNMIRQDMNYNKQNFNQSEIHNLTILITNYNGKFKYDSANYPNKMRIGSLIEIHIDSQKYDAVVLQISMKTDEVQVKILNKKNLVNGSYPFNLKFKFIEVPYERMLEGLHFFNIGKLNKNIENVILGKFEAILPSNFLLPNESLSAPGLPILNESQSDCVTKVLQSSLSLIQGPPGTGKTHVSATIIYHIAKLIQNEKILVCSSSNTAVDNITERISKTGINVVKVCSRIRESIQSPVDHLSLHVLLKQYISKNHSEFLNTYEMRTEYDE